MASSAGPAQVSDEILARVSAAPFPLSEPRARAQSPIPVSVALRANLAWSALRWAIGASVVLTTTLYILLVPPAGAVSQECQGSEIPTLRIWVSLATFRIVMCALLRAITAVAFDVRALPSRQRSAVYSFNRMEYVVQLLGIMWNTIGCMFFYSAGNGPITCPGAPHFISLGVWSLMLILLIYLLFFLPMLTEFALRCAMSVPCWTSGAAATIQWLRRTGLTTARGHVTYNAPPPPPPPATERQIKKLRSETFRVGRFPADSAHCVICQQDYTAGQSLRILPCGDDTPQQGGASSSPAAAPAHPVVAHHFHAACIERWLRETASCPICRQSMLLQPPGGAAPSPSPSIGGPPAPGPVSVSRPADPLAGGPYVDPYRTTDGGAPAAGSPSSDRGAGSGAHPIAGHGAAAGYVVAGYGLQPATSMQLQLQRRSRLRVRTATPVLASSPSPRVSGGGGGNGSAADACLSPAARAGFDFSPSSAGEQVAGARGSAAGAGGSAPEPRGRPLPRYELLVGYGSPGGALAPPPSALISPHVRLGGASAAVSPTRSFPPASSASLSTSTRGPRAGQAPLPVPRVGTIAYAETGPRTGSNASSPTGPDAPALGPACFAAEDEVRLSVEEEGGRVGAGTGQGSYFGAMAPPPPFAAAAQGGIFAGRAAQDGPDADDPASDAADAALFRGLVGSPPPSLSSTR